MNLSSKKIIIHVHVHTWEQCKLQSNKFKYHVTVRRKIYKKVTIYVFMCLFQSCTSDCFKIRFYETFFRIITKER